MLQKERELLIVGRKEKIRPTFTKKRKEHICDECKHKVKKVSRYRSL